MLADIDHLHHVGVHAGLADGAPESRLVHPRRAGGDHHPRQPLLLDGVDDGALPRVGTGVLEGLGVQHVAHGERRLGHLVGGHGAGDVGAALADEDADTHGSAPRRRLAGGRPGCCRRGPGGCRREPGCFRRGPGCCRRATGSLADFG